MAKKKELGAVMNEPNVVPMADVMLVMLIIFMVVTPMLTKGISVDMVKTQNPIAMQAADKDDAILVAITREGRTYLGTSQVNPEEIPAKVKDLLANRMDRTCYIRADARARYERVVDVVDNLRAAGVDQVGLLTEQVKSKTASAEVE